MTQVSSEVAVSAQGTLATRLRVLKQHVGVTALDLWADTDHNGLPDQHLARVKAPNVHENEQVILGDPTAFVGKILQWIWMPSLPPGLNEDWSVEITISQAKLATDPFVPLANFPLSLSGKYPAGLRHGLFQTWFRLVTK